MTTDIIAQAAAAIAYRADERIQPSRVVALRVTIEWHRARLLAGRDVCRMLGDGEWRLLGEERALRDAITRIGLEWNWHDDEVRGAA